MFTTFTAHVATKDFVLNSSEHNNNPFEKAEKFQQFLTTPTEQNCTHEQIKK
jgi:hypothetical protein